MGLRSVAADGDGEDRGSIEEGGTGICSHCINISYSFWMER
jgi:hypothetical protein